MIVAVMLLATLVSLVAGANEITKCVIKSCSG
jgi:hypothetical protein